MNGKHAPKISKQKFKSTSRVYKNLSTAAARAKKLAKLFLKAGGGAARPQRLRGGGRPPFGARARARARAR